MSLVHSLAVVQCPLALLGVPAHLALWGETAVDSCVFVGLTSVKAAASVTEVRLVLYVSL